VDEAIRDGRSSGCVVKEGAPVFESEVCGDDGGGAEVSAIEDLVEEVCASGIETQVTEFVDDEEVGGCPCRKASLQGIPLLAGDEVVDEVCGGDEANAISPQAGELSDGVGEVCFADPGGADKDAVCLVFDKLQSGCAHDDFPVDGFGVVEIEGVEASEWKDGGAFNGALSSYFNLTAELLSHEVIEELCG